MVPKSALYSHSSAGDPFNASHAEDHGHATALICYCGIVNEGWAHQSDFFYLVESREVTRYSVMDAMAAGSEATDATQWTARDVAAIYMVMRYKTKQENTSGESTLHSARNLQGARAW